MMRTKVIKIEPILNFSILTNTLFRDILWKTGTWALPDLCVSEYLKRG